MIISTSSFGTRRAYDYLKELSVHFAKRVPVQAEKAQARVTLPIGTCDLTASGTGITARIHVSPDHVDRMEEVFGGRIERIAFRENANLTWQRATRSYEGLTHVSQVTLMRCGPDMQAPHAAETMFTVANTFEDPQMTGGAKSQPSRSARTSMPIRPQRLGRMWRSPTSSTSMKSMWRRYVYADHDCQCHGTARQQPDAC